MFAGTYGNKVMGRKERAQYWWVRIPLRSLYCPYPRLPINYGRYIAGHSATESVHRPFTVGGHMHVSEGTGWIMFTKKSLTLSTSIPHRPPHSLHPFCWTTGAPTRGHIWGHINKWKMTRLDTLGGSLEQSFFVSISVICSIVVPMTSFNINMTIPACCNASAPHFGRGYTRRCMCSPFSFSQTQLYGWFYLLVCIYYDVRVLQFF